MSLPKPYYQQDGITIYHADCRDILPFLEPVDLVLTDPPYGIGQSSGKHGGSVLAVLTDYGNKDWDNSPISEDLMNMAIGMGRKSIIWGGNYYNVAPSPSWLVWDKRNGRNNFADCELAWSNLGCAVRKIEHLWHGMLREGREKRYHPTQKPLKVMTWCLSFVPDAKTVLDPFKGSGTTLVACKQLGIECIGIDFEEEYCEIAVKRLAQQVMRFE